MSEMGTLIHNLRIMKGYSLEQLGDKVGVGKSTVRKWETGAIENMKRDKIIAVAKALGVDPEYLMGWTPEPTDTLMETFIVSVKKGRDIKEIIDKIHNCTDEQFEKIKDYVDMVTSYKQNP